MILVKFLESPELNLYNLPDRLMAYVANTTEHTNNPLEIYIEEHNRNIFIETVSVVMVGYSCISLGDTITLAVLRNSTNEAGPTPIRAESERRDGVIIDENLEEEDEEEDDSQEEGVVSNIIDIISNSSHRGPLRQFLESRNSAIISNDELKARIFSLASGNNNAEVLRRNELKTAMEALLARMIQTQRELNRLNDRITKDYTAASLVEQIEQVRSTNNNKVDNIFISNDHIVVCTEELIADCRQDNIKRKIGKMEFYISIEAFASPVVPSGFIRIRNSSREIKIGGDYYQAPHVSGNGNACFGNVSSSLVDCVSKGDLTSLITLLIRFIESPFEDDIMGRHVVNFPKIDNAVRNNPVEVN